jgi:hypothetical protein
MSDAKDAMIIIPTLLITGSSLSVLQQAAVRKGKRVSCLFLAVAYR